MDEAADLRTVFDRMRAASDLNWSEAVRLSDPQMAYLIEEDRGFDEAPADNYRVLAEGPVLVSRLPRRSDQSGAGRASETARSARR